MIRYGKEWPNSNDGALAAEKFAIRCGGNWTDEYGKPQTTDLSQHYEAFRKIVFPRLDSHRWHNLCRDEIVKSKVTVLMGPASSGKTNAAAWISLVDYWCFPECTCVLVSSTDIRGLRKRVWGEIVTLWKEGKDKFDWLGGNLLDSALAITTDNLEDCEPGEIKIRDMRLGIFAVPCVQGGRQVGLSKFHGIKQKRMRLVADEASAMSDTFLSSFSNLSKNEDFRAIILGNPSDLMDPLGRAAEPAGGWSDEFMEPSKTKVWDTRFMDGRCVNLIGMDSPNFDFPPEKPTRYKYLISKEKIDDTLSFFPKDSPEFYEQCWGCMKIGTVARRILSRELCIRFEAQKQVIWDGAFPRTKVYFVDASYGGDRCVGGSAEIGIELGGKQVLSFNTPRIIPVTIGSGMEAEEQIAKAVKDDCIDQDINARNMGHDSTGRGALGTALAREWSSWTNPIEFGGTPTDRPVSLDMRVLDEETGQMRYKTCREHYDRFTSELWFSVRYAVEAGQIRDLPDEAMEELCTRKWENWKDGKKKIEVKDGTPTKPGYKQRVGKSPDMGDWASGIVEMARRRGLVISKLAVEPKKSSKSSDWLAAEADAYAKMQSTKELRLA